MALIVNGRGIAGIRSGVAAGPSTPSIVTDGLKVYLDAGQTSSYPGTGTLWTDISGNGNNGTLNGAGGSGLPSYNSANGGSIAFDGTDDSVVIGNSPVFPSNVGTWSVWFYFTTITNRMTIIQRHSSLSVNGIVAYVSSSQSVSLQLYGASSATNLLSLGTPLNSVLSNRWNNLTITFNSNNPLNIYINGIFSTTGTPTSTWNFNNQNITLGRSPDTFWKAYNGNISITKIYNRVLSSTEITQNYIALKSRYGL